MDKDGVNRKKTYENIDDDVVNTNSWKSECSIRMDREEKTVDEHRSRIKTNEWNEFREITKSIYFTASDK